MLFGSVCRLHLAGMSLPEKQQKLIAKYGVIENARSG
jgi:hypothetical protein